MSSKSQAARGQGRNRTFKLHPATHAIRHALALGLAMAATQPVFAGTCDVSTPATAVCNGVFVDESIAYAIDDLTLIVGGASPTTISPLDGDAGIDLYAALGAISLTSHADITAISTTNAAFGIRLETVYGDASLTNTGDVHAETAGNVIGAVDVYGLYALSNHGDVTVVNSGDVTAIGGGATSSIPYVYGSMNVVGIAGVTGDGNVSIGNSGALAIGAPGLTPYGSSAFGIVAHADTGDITVTNTDTGSITVAQPSGYANGITAYTHSGGVTIDNAGTISVDSTLGASVAIAAQSKYGTGAVAVTSSGTLDVVGYSSSFGIIAKGDAGGVAVDNTGSISVEAMHAGTATGISAQTKYSDTGIVNGGDITTVSHDVPLSHGAAVGISALTVYDGDLHVDNTGNILASAYAANGVSATAKYGAVAVSNASGANIVVDGARTVGVSAMAKYDGSAAVDNAGMISASGRYEATGVHAATLYGPYGVNPGIVSVTNTGTITATSAYFQAHGVVADGYSGVAISNAGDISATGYLATGVLANSYLGGVELVNADTGTITATGLREADGAVLYASEVARLLNYGDITAVAHFTDGEVKAYGSAALAGISVTLNYGAITADSTVDGDGTALAFGALGYGNAVTIVNEGDVAARATAGSGVAAAFGAYAYGEYNAIYNYGHVAATAHVGNGSAYATGAGSIGVGGSTFHNAAGSIVTGEAQVADGKAVAAGLDQFGLYIADATNAGDIVATADSTVYGFATAVGLRNVTYGDATVTNSGAITVATHAYLGVADSMGVDNMGVYYSATVTNDGALTASAVADTGYAYATGIRNTSYEGASTIANGGDILAVATSGWGIAEATGVDTLGAAYGPTLSNTGTIVASATTARGYTTAIGTQLYGANGDVSVDNAGGISATATAHSDYGRAITAGANVQASYFSTTHASLVNHGDIFATSIADGANSYASAMAAGESGKYAAQDNDGTIVAQATGTLAFAFGSSALGWDGATETNDGTIQAHATAGFYANARAVVDNAYSSGYVVTVNHGDVLATSQVAGDYSTGIGGVAYAFGTTSMGKYTADFDNTGSITAIATAPFGLARAVAVSVDGKKGNSTVTNSGDIFASASAYHYAAIATGMDVESGFDAITTNDGSVTALASADHSDISASAVGLSSSSWGINGSGSLVNNGDIHGGATAYDGKAYAVGAGVRGTIDSTMRNYGDITAASQADAGLAIARAAYTVSTGDRVLDGCAPDYSVCYYHSAGGNVSAGNHGQMLVQADAAAGDAFAYGSVAMGLSTTTDNAATISALARATDGTATAVGSFTAGNMAGLTNAGDIQAVALAADGTANAMGAVATGDFGAYGNAVWYFYNTTYNVDSHAYNAGAIDALADAGTGIATATALVVASQHGDVAITNAGHLAAQADGGDGSVATGVRMDSIGSSTLVNTGSIVATGTNASHIAVWSGDNAAASIDNQGLMTGALRTGGLADMFTSSGTWNAEGASDFGAGDDTIANTGMLHLRDATISLGDTGALGNGFANSGTITVAGTNRIDMGAGNARAFDNAGTIDFRDGVPDDTLTIGGDFAGSGHLAVDVSGLHGTSDVLYVEGNVAGGVHTVDVTLLDMPTTANSRVMVARVAGASTANDFVLGDVHYNAGNFLALAFQPRVVGTIDTANATADVFALDMSVTGLNDTGALAAAIAPGAQSLMASQVGNWRQRVGMAPKFGERGVGAWARMFRNEGTIDPSQDASNFGQGGRFAFDQRNSGIEAGVDVGLNEQVSIGALLAKGSGHQHLADNGAGGSKLDGDTVGVYGTWLSPAGFYLDASYRRMRFDARLQSAAGTITGNGDATAFNVEAGYAWTSDNGLAFEPQLQYTHTQVDRIDALAGGVSAFRAEGGTAATGRAGVMVRKDFTHDGATWTPYATVNAVREFDGRNAYSINDVFFGATSTEGTSTLAEGGVDVRIGEHVRFSGSLLWQDGGAMQGFFGGQLGVRYTW